MLILLLSVEAHNRSPKPHGGGGAVDDPQRQVALPIIPVVRQRNSASQGLVSAALMPSLARARLSMLTTPRDKHRRRGQVLGRELKGTDTPFISAQFVS